MRNLPFPVQIRLDVLPGVAGLTLGDLFGCAGGNHLAAELHALCEPPETFNYGGVIAHNLTFSAYRRTVAIEVFEQIGITDLGSGDSY